jgi:hypothetical protein
VRAGGGGDALRRGALVVPHKRPRVIIGARLSSHPQFHGSFPTAARRCAQPCSILAPFRPRRRMPILYSGSTGTFVILRLQIFRRVWFVTSSLRSL